MDGSSVIDGVEQTNRLIFVDFLLALSLSNQYQGAEKTAAIFRTGKNYRLNSNVLAFNDKEKDKIYLQQLVGRQERKTISVPDDIPRYSERLEVETTTFYPQDDGAYYYPLSAVTLIDTDAESEAIFQVPAIYVKAISDEAEWQDIALALRIGGNVLAIVLGIATLGAGSPLLIGLAVADITLATTDILVAVSQDPLMQTADGQEFLNSWDKIYLAGGIATAAPLLVGNAFSMGAKLLSKATLATTKNFLRASLLKMAMELNIPNFAKGSLKVLDTGIEVRQATHTVIQMNAATRLQEAGVLFVKGEITGGRAAKNGLVVIYKGEVIASGEAKAVKNSLGDIWKLKGAKLIEALESRLWLKNIDEAVQRLGINITVPKNTLNAVQSERRLHRIIRSLERKIPPKIFNPNKKALKELGIKLPKSKTGLSVDFADSPYLYPVTGNQKNIVKIKLTGTRRNDDRLAYELSGIRKNKNYTWHHLDDYDSTTNTCTMQLVDLEIHVKTYPHYGSVELVKQFFNIKKY